MAERVAGQLFADNPDHTPLWLPAPANDLFAWISRKLQLQQDNGVKWARGIDKITERSFTRISLKPSMPMTPSRRSLTGLN